MSRKIPLEEVKYRLLIVHGENVKIIDETYKSCGVKATFIDKDYGKWTAQVKSILEGRRHTDHKCVNWKTSRILSERDIQKRLLKAHNGTVTLAPGQIYVNSHEMMKFIDQNFGEWEAQPYSVFAGHGHPERGKLNSSKKKREGILSGRLKRLPPYHGKRSFYEHDGKIYSFRSSYEKRFAKILDRDNHEWSYEEKSFNVCDGTKTYTPDFEIKNLGFVEVKGWWRDDAEEKFNSFISTYGHQHRLILVMKNELVLLENKNVTIESLFQNTKI